MSDILELESNTISQTSVVYYLQAYLKIISVIIITHVHVGIVSESETAFFLLIKNVYFKTLFLLKYIRILRYYNNILLMAYFAEGTYM